MMPVEVTGHLTLASQIHPHLEDGSVYSQLWPRPTRLEPAIRVVMPKGETTGPPQGR